MAYSGKDYLGDKRLSQELADKIHKYWVHKVPNIKVWVEPFYILAFERVWLEADLKTRYTHPQFVAL